MPRYKPETLRAIFEVNFVGDETPEGEQRMFCPICEDPNLSHSPSASMNIEEGKWNCLKGEHGGSISSLVAELKNEGWDVASLAARTKTPPKRPEKPVKKASDLPTQSQLDAWTADLMDDPRVRNKLMEQRGITLETIASSQLGWDGRRYVIPVYDVDGELINVRRYALGASSGQKMLNAPGHGTAALYRPDRLKEAREVVITEGEMDCILLNQHGIPAVTHTAGASTFRPAWGPMFEGKRVWICYDVDDAGRAGSVKVKRAIEKFADAVYIIDLPLETKGADVTDYLHGEGYTGDDFRALMDEAAAEESDAPISVPEYGLEVSLQESMSQERQGESLSLTVSIAGKQQEPFLVPKRFVVYCDQSKASCKMCPVALAGGKLEINIRENSADLFRMVDSSEQRQRQILMEISGARCGTRAEIDILENWNVEELLTLPSVDNRKDDETQQPVRRTIFSVSTHKTEVNRKVNIVGKNVPDPKSGKMRFLAWKNTPVDLDIDKFDLPEDQRARLQRFKVGPDESPLDKCFDIAADMAENVTHIYGRDILHVAYDLVWHSVLSFKIGDMDVDKGWLEMMVVGDTRTGKSEIAHQLVKHYQSGLVQSCEGMSFPGLIGGVQQIDNRWHMTWGVIPMNDRRMVVLDEVSGLHEKNVIEQMSSVRSSGIAQVTKIVSEETSARTRLAWITNPADGSMIMQHSQRGIGALRTVVPAAEDIARFDFVVATAKDDVDPKIINAGFTEKHSPSYPSQDCEALIKWIWSRTRDQVVVTYKAAKAATNAALEMGERYVSDPPLIQGENVRFKILRIAAALAGRTFSHDRQDRLLVQEDHVLDAVRFLDMIYSEESLGYARMSRRTIEARKRAKERKEQVKDYLRQEQDTVFLTLRMVGGDVFRSRELEDFGGMEKIAARTAMQQLVKWGVAELKTRGEVKMGPVLTDAIRELEEELEDALDTS